jgi:hypothetical protein
MNQFPSKFGWSLEHAKQRVPGRRRAEALAARVHPFEELSASAMEPSEVSVRRPLSQRN